MRHLPLSQKKPESLNGKFFRSGSFGEGGGGEREGKGKVGDWVNYAHMHTRMLLMYMYMYLHRGGKWCAEAWLAPSTLTSDEKEE